MNSRMMTFLLILACAGSARAVTTVTLRSEAGVRDEFVRLSAVATISGDKADRIAGLYLGRAPEKDGLITIRREDVQNRARLMGIAASEVKFAGAQAVTVRRTEQAPHLEPELMSIQPAPVRAVSRPAVAAAPAPKDAEAERVVAGIQQVAEKYLTELFGMPEVKLTLKPIATDYKPDDARKAAGLLVERGPEGRLTGRVEFQLAFVDAAGNRIGNVAASYEVEASAPVLMLKAPLRRGDTVSEDSLIREYRSITGRAAFVTDPRQVLARRATRSVRERSPLEAADFESVPDVERNQIVEIVSASGGFSIRVLGRAQAAAKAGDAVIVQNMDSGQKLLARVVAPGVVTVDPR
mgnify:CR=1 FL=1